MFAFLKKLFEPESFLSDKRFLKRVDDLLTEHLGDAPTLWSIDAMMKTTEAVEAWIVKNEKAITEEQFIEILMHYIDLYLDKPLPPNFLFKTLREAKTHHFEPKS